MATSTLVTANLEANTSAQGPEALQRVLCIQYLEGFEKSQLIQALINFDSNVNAITPAYKVKLGLTT